MAITIQRPAPAAKPAGLLGYDQFQLAYVTNDLDRAMELFRTENKVRNWTVIEPGGGMRIALAWMNGHQFELIDTGPTEQPLYDDWIEKDGDFVIRHHHYGYYVYDDAEWALLNEQIDAAGRERLMDVETDILKVIYIYAPELGHFLEYIFPNDHGKAFFESIAAN